MEKDKIGQELTKEEIKKTLDELEGIDVSSSGNILEGEYKEHSFIIDEENRVEVTGKIKGEKPRGAIEIVTKEEGVALVKIKVEGYLEGGTITAIEAISDGIETIEDSGTPNTDTVKMFAVRDNGEYVFRIKGSNNRSIKISCNITNAIPSRKDLLTAIALINKGGEQKVQIKGKASSKSEVETEIYSLNVIRIEGDVILGDKLLVNGEEKEITGISHSGVVYTVGSQSDVATETSYAKNTVVLKVEGNLTINSGVKLTSVASSGGFGGPKGMIVYSTETLTNNGEISMTARGAKAKGQNVYLVQNLDTSFEFIPAIGASGGVGVTGRKVGNVGNSGTGRQTGGGGSGSGSTITSGTGGVGSSYSGGPGTGGGAGSGSGQNRP